MVGDGGGHVHLILKHKLTAFERLYNAVRSEILGRRSIQNWRHARGVEGCMLA